MKPALRAPMRESLTPGELRALQAMADYGRMKLAADSLGVSPETVRTHLKAVYGKMGVRSIVSAVVEGFRRGLIE